MTKPRVFIGASRENQDVSEAIQQDIEYHSEGEVWDQGTFGPSQYPLESLENKLESTDFAIFVFVPDDVTTAREKKTHTVRDNVLFELGLFMGKISRERTFVIVPRGVELHLPTDLDGLTLLYYDANRDDGNLKAALGPACTTIRAAMKKQRPLPRPSREVAAQESDQSPESERGFPAEFFVPDTTWDTEKYTRGYFIAVFSGRSSEAKAIDKAFRESILASSAEDLAVWEATCDWMHIENGDNRSIKYFKDSAKSYPKNAILKDLLGRALSHYGNKAEARKTFELAAQTSQDPALTGAIITRAINASNAAEETVDWQKYHSLLRNAMGTGPDLFSEILYPMKVLAKIRGLAAVSKGIDEVRMMASPDNISLRFGLAHQYSEDNQPSLSILHYEAIPERERDGASWNNLGVSFATLGMPGRAVDAYKAASAKGETLADANLAHKLVIAGFLEEARKRAEDAVKIEDHHENVVGALAAIQSAEDNERVKAAEAASAAHTEQEYLIDLGQAALSVNEINIAGLWETPEGQIEICSSGNGNWTGRGEIEKEAALDLNSLLSGGQKHKEITDLEYSLTRFGNALEGKVKRHARDQKPTSLLGYALDTYGRTVTIRVADDGQSLAVREIGHDTSTATWKRVRPLITKDEHISSAGSDGIK